MAALKGWLLAVLAVSLLTAVAQTVMPEGTVKAVGRLACGLLLFLAVAKPVLGINYAAMTAAIQDYTQAAAQAETECVQTKNSLTESIIARETEAYILDKTEELGLDCTATVVWDWSGELPAPVQVRVTGHLSQRERQMLEDSLTRELGLEREQIIYADEEEP